MTALPDQDCLWPRAIIALRAEDAGAAPLLERLAASLEAQAAVAGDGELGWLDVTHCQAAHGSPLRVAERLAERLARNSDIRIWSIGVAASLVVARYAAAEADNARIRSIPPWETMTILADADLVRILADQPELVRYLARRGVRKCAELRHCRPEWLRRYPLARQLWLACAGADHTTAAPPPMDEAPVHEHLVLPPRTSHTPTLRRYLLQLCRRTLAALGTRHGAGAQLDIGLELAGPGPTLRATLDLSRERLPATLLVGVERLLAQRPAGRAVTRICARARHTETRGLQLSLFA
jgi:hypothetical protein